MSSIYRIIGKTIESITVAWFAVVCAASVVIVFAALCLLLVAAGVFLTACMPFIIYQEVAGC